MDESEKSKAFANECSCLGAVCVNSLGGLGAAAKSLS